MAIRAYTLSRNSFCQVGTIDCNTRQGEWKLFLTMTPTECNRAQVYYYAGTSSLERSECNEKTADNDEEFRRGYSLGKSLSGFALEIVPSLLSMIILGVLRICS